MNTPSAPTQRAAETTEKGIFKEEIVPVMVPQRKGDPIAISEDEEYKRVKLRKSLRCVPPSPRMEP